MNNTSASVAPVSAGCLRIWKCWSMDLNVLCRARFSLCSLVSKCCFKSYRPEELTLTFFLQGTQNENSRPSDDACCVLSFLKAWALPFFQVSAPTATRLAGGCMSSFGFPMLHELFCSLEIFWRTAAPASFGSKQVSACAKPIYRSLVCAERDLRREVDKCVVCFAASFSENELIVTGPYFENFPYKLCLPVQKSVYGRTT